MRCLLFAAFVASSLVACKGMSKSAGGDAAASASASAAATAAPTTPFEGELAVTISGPKIKQPIDIVYEFKGDKARFDFKTGFGSMGPPWGLISPDHKVYVVLDKAKMVSVVDIAKVMHAEAKTWKAVKTGKSDTVASNKCDEWELVGEGSKKKHVLCNMAAAFHFPFGDLAGAHEESGFAWHSDFERDGLMPLRAVSYGESGAEESRWEVTRIDRKAIDDARFKVPDGYRHMTTPIVPMKGM
jgi:hypothetical protein